MKPRVVVGICFALMAVLTWQAYVFFPKPKTEAVSRVVYSTTTTEREVTVIVDGQTRKALVPIHETQPNVLTEYIKKPADAMDWIKVIAIFGMMALTFVVLVAYIILHFRDKWGGKSTSADARHTAQVVDTMMKISFGIITGFAGGVSLPATSGQSTVTPALQSQTQESSMNKTGEKGAIPGLPMPTIQPVPKSTAAKAD